MFDEHLVHIEKFQTIKKAFDYILGTITLQSIR